MLLQLAPGSCDIWNRSITLIPPKHFFTNELDFLKAHVVSIHHKTIRKCFKCH